MKRSLYIAGLAVICVSICWITAGRRNIPQPELPEAPAAAATVPAPRESLVNQCNAKFENIKLRGFWEDRGYEYSQLIRYVDNVRTDSTAIIGECDGLRCDNQFCRLMWGIDSRTIDLTQKLDKTIDMRFLGALPDCEFHTFRLDGSFKVCIALPNSAPDWILNRISKDLQPIVNTYNENAAKDRFVLKYDGSPDFLDKMVRYYYKRFHRYYSRQAERARAKAAEKAEGEEDSDDTYFCWYYSYLYYAYPVWVDEENSRITYRTYEFQNMGGAHGSYSDHYSTYDSATGRLLGINDLLSDEEMDKAIEQLEKDWYSYEMEMAGRSDFDPNGRRSADFGSESGTSDTFVSQIYKGKDYPRPAFTRHGVVFSYPMYTKGGCTAEGVRHFVVPYHKLK